MHENKAAIKKDTHFLLMAHHHHHRRRIKQNTKYPAHTWPDHATKLLFINDKQ